MSTSWHRNVVAITSSIGGGKSTVASIFAQLGAFVLSADELSRQAVEPGSPALEAIEKEFGSEVLLADGTLNRKALGERVFSNAEAREKLEAIVHPAIRELAKESFESAFLNKHPLYLYEIPLLFETGLHQGVFKKIILVVSDRETSLERIQKRDGLSREAVVKRLEAQIPIEEKLPLSDIVIENNGSLEELNLRVRSVYKTLVEEGSSVVEE